MTLKEIMNWKALHFNDRTIIRKDLSVMSASLLYAMLHLEIEPMAEPGHYKVKEK